MWYFFFDFSINAKFSIICKIPISADVVIHAETVVVYSLCVFLDVNASASDLQEYKCQFDVSIFFSYLIPLFVCFYVYSCL